MQVWLALPGRAIAAAAGRHDRQDIARFEFRFALGPDSSSLAVQFEAGAAAIGEACEIS